MRATAAAVAVLMLVACGSQGKNANRSAADKAGGKAAGADQLQPGQWEMVSQVKAIELPGAPPEAQAQVRSQIGQSQTNQECITPERARNPLQQMRQMMAQGPTARCRFTDQTFGGGVIRIRATCPNSGGGGGGGTVSLEGSFTGTTIQATMSVNAQGANPAMPGATAMRVSAEIRGRRIGECPAGAPPASAPPGNGL